MKQLRPRLPAACIYVITDAGFRNCKTLDEFVSAYGSAHLLDILAGAEELPAYGILNLAQVARRDLRKVPRVLSRFPVLDRGIGGFFSGELSVWTGKRGVGKSTILGQLLSLIHICRLRRSPLRSIARGVWKSPFLTDCKTRRSQ